MATKDYQIIEKGMIKFNISKLFYNTIQRISRINSRFSEQKESSGQKRVSRVEDQLNGEKGFFRSCCLFLTAVFAHLR